MSRGAMAFNTMFFMALRRGGWVHLRWEHPNSPWKSPSGKVMRYNEIMLYALYLIDRGAGEGAKPA